MDTLYRVELRHHDLDRADEEDKEHVTGKKVQVTSDWLCAWLGSEHLCVNVSLRLGGGGTGEVRTGLSHSFHLLNATGNYCFIHTHFTHSDLAKCLSLYFLWV